MISILKLECSFICRKRNTLLTNTDWSHIYVHAPYCYKIIINSISFMIFDITGDQRNCIKLSIFIPLYQNINIHILPNVSLLYIFYGTDEENLVDDQELPKLAIIFLSLRDLYILFKGESYKENSKASCSLGLVC